MAEIVEDRVLIDKVRVFDDRRHAGRLLAKKLSNYSDRKDVLILAIPAGGVPVAFEVAKELKIPMDLAVTRKLHLPSNREAGFGAVTWDGYVLLNEKLVNLTGITREEIDRVVADEKEAIEGRLRRFRGGRPFPEVRDKTIVVIDDGLATGFSMLATVKSLRAKGAKKVVVAVPTAPADAINLLKPHADEIVCLNVRSGPFFAVSDAYKVWYDLTDEDVTDVLTQKYARETNDF
jgi:predicted phosphoribosyltransferase